MATEIFTNNWTGTLNGAINAAATSLTLTSATAPSGYVLATGTVTLLIDTEYVRGTHNGSGSVTSLTRGYDSSTAAAHANGAAVTAVLTAGNLGQRITDDIATHTALPNVHHNQAHVLTGADHTASGLSTGQVLKATAATTFGFGTVAQAVTHDSPDTDTGTGSLHHTIGASATQAAAGNHTHTGMALTTVEVNLSSAVRRSGKFTIAGAGLVTGKPVHVLQASGPYTGKGTRTDEAEMDAITATGKVISSTVIECFWSAARLVRGNYKFDYVISA